VRVLADITGVSDWRGMYERAHVCVVCEEYSCMSERGLAVPDGWFGGRSCYALPGWQEALCMLRYSSRVFGGVKGVCMHPGPEFVPYSAGQVYAGGHCLAGSLTLV
jgi:hypothetical protein